jgi:nucleotidyltransferase substrate binding protein (TIGR01987 family)
MKHENEQIDLTSLAKAVESLYRALNEYQKDKSNEFVRDSCIQRFEYCYDLSTKMMKRYLAMIAESPGEIKSMTFQNLVREAYTKGISKNSWDRWWEYRDNRNKTSHGYDEKIAIEVVEKIGDFYQEAIFMVEALREANEDQV